MLRIRHDALEIIRMLRPTIEQLHRRDRNLADQLDRATTSVVLNMAEGDAAQGATRRHCYTISLREARESVAALQVAEAKRLVRRPEGIDARFDHVIGVLVKLTR